VAKGTGAVSGPPDTWASVVLLVRARTRLCALPIERLVETMRPLPTTPFAGAPSFVLGVARIRGAAVPVVDLGALLGSREPSQATRYLALRLDGSRRVALAVEAVVGLRSLAPAQLAELPPLLANADREAVAAIGTLDAELLLSLETTRIVPDRLWPVQDVGGAP
jgi:purine-binding chemotaxis protein CheW